MDDHTVIGRVAFLLDVVAARGPDVSLAELTSLTAIPKPSIVRIAAGLVSRGLLVRSAAGYSLGTTLITWGAGAQRQHGARRRAEPVLAELHERTRQLSWVVTLDGARPTGVETFPAATRR